MASRKYPLKSQCSEERKHPPPPPSLPPHLTWTAGIPLHAAPVRRGGDGEHISSEGILFSPRAFYLLGLLFRACVSPSQENDRSRDEIRHSDVCSGGGEDTDTCRGKKRCEERGRAWSDMSTIQRTPRTARTHRQPGERLGTDSPLKPVQRPGPADILTAHSWPPEL